jgi:hypothetical protein
VSIGSSSKVLLHLQQKTVVRLIGSDDNRRERQWWSTVDRAAGSGEWSREEGGCSHGVNEVREDSSAAPTCGDKVTNTCGAAMTGR